MGSLLRTVKKCKKSRRLGKVEVVKREEYGGLEVDSKVEMIRALVPLGLMHVQELLDDEVKALAVERYAHVDDEHLVAAVENIANPAQKEQDIPRRFSRLPRRRT